MQKPSGHLSQEITNYVKDHPGCSSREIHEGLVEAASYATLKRRIQELVQEGFLKKNGKGKATRYELSLEYQILFPVDIDQYFKKEIDEREIKEQFNHKLIKHDLRKTSLFSNEEMSYLQNLQKKFEKNINELSPEEFRKEFERLAIDLSWKSSQIEGNTYSLLETERLLKEQQTASGKTRDEATMLLNHKAALDFLLDYPDYLSPLSISKIEDIHSILVRDLPVKRNIRVRRVGISGTNYKPLDNEFQIREALESVCLLVNETTNIFRKALLALVLLSYIQPFADGNKRTARITSNAILLHHRYCPISFRTVDSLDYKKAMLVFYEQNNISPFKKIFIEQYEFAVRTYF
jgi:Fic family protein